jgi:hypothetical protein
LAEPRVDEMVGSMVDLGIFKYKFLLTLLQEIDNTRKVPEGCRDGWLLGSEDG